MADDNYPLGDYLRQLREDSNLSQGRAHRDRPGVPSQGYQSKVERGEFRDVDVDTLLAWVDGLGGDRFKAFQLWVDERERRIATMPPPPKWDIPGYRVLLTYPRATISSLRTLRARRVDTPLAA